MDEETKALIVSLRNPKPPHYGKCLKAADALQAQAERVKALEEENAALQLANPIERETLLRVRSFITKHGAKEVDAYCAQRLHDMQMDARSLMENTNG